MKNSIIENLKKEYKKETVEKYGFPYIGTTPNNKFSKDIEKIKTSWNYYDNDLYNIKNNKEIIRLGNGSPLSRKPFPGCIDKLKETLKRNDLYKYQPAAGDEENRNIISKYLIKIGYPEHINYENVITTNSTTYGFYLILNSIFKPNDVIIMTGPNYGLFTFMPERLGIKVEILKLKKENNYHIDSEELNKLIIKINNKLKKEYKDNDYIPKVRAFFNMNPHNPTGIVLGIDNINELTEIGKVCKNNDVFIIDDLIYRDLTYKKDNIAIPIGTINDYFDNTISLFGLSKSYSLASTRAGFIAANKEVIKLLRNNTFYQMDSASLLQSSLVVGAYNDSNKRQKYYNKYFKKLNEEYIFNMYLSIAMIEGLNKVDNEIYKNKVYKFINSKIKDKKLFNQIVNGIPYSKVVIKPESGYFLLVDFTELKINNKVKSEKEFLYKIYELSGIKFLIGQSFSWPYKDEIIVRISYSFNKDDLLNYYIELNKAVYKQFV